MGRAAPTATTRDSGLDFRYGTGILIAGFRH
jgi:hypothetical protein